MRFSSIVVASLTLVAGAAHAEPKACEALKGVSIPAARIGLPSSGATVKSAEWIAKAGAMPDYCKVVGEVAPRDPKSTPVVFQVNLPEAWNRKTVQFGGGGLNGTLVTAVGPLRDQPPATPVPLAQGYATFGTDGGHPNAKPDVQVFALNREALENHAYGAYKKTYDVAMVLIRDYFGAAPKRSYFFGGSEGGREALIAVQRFPKDYDGAVSTVPVQSWTALQLAGYDQWLRLRSGAAFTAPQLRLLSKAVIAKCDDADGLADGVISQYRGCEKKFDPASLLCPAGQASGDSCLSEAQVAFVRRIHTPYDLGFTIANGVKAYPAFAFGGEAQPGGYLPTQLADYAAGDVRYFIAENPNFTGPLDLKKYRDRIREISRLMDATDPDLSAFAGRGGKLIVKENGTDYVQSPISGYEYNDAVVRRMGAAKVKRFMRLYVTPGAGHGGGGQQADGTPIPDRVDLLGVLDDWVEGRRAAPEQLVLSSYSQQAPATPTASRPLCSYPTYPHYSGTGASTEASSYTCRPLPKP